MRFTHLLFLLPAILMASVSIQAQDVAELIINNNGTLSLPQDTELTERYSFDISSLEFSSLEDAVEYFSDFNSKYLAFRPDISNQTAHLYLQLSKRPQWTIEQWNDLLSTNVIFTK